MVRIWHKRHKSMDLFCLLSTVQAGGVMVWWIISWNTLGPFVPTEHCLKATVENDCPFMTKGTQSSTSSRMMHHVTKLNSSQTGFLTMTMSSLSGVLSHRIHLFLFFCCFRIYHSNISQIQAYNHVCPDSIHT